MNVILLSMEGKADDIQKIPSRLPHSRESPNTSVTKYHLSCGASSTVYPITILVHTLTS